MSLLDQSWFKYEVQAPFHDNMPKYLESLREEAKKKGIKRFMVEITIPTHYGRTAILGWRAAADDEILSKDKDPWVYIPEVSRYRIGVFEIKGGQDD
jgi:hypothetical protein